MKKWLLVSVLIMTFANAKELDITKGMFRASFENVTISPSENMGLFGISYLLSPNEYFYYGMSVYGTLTGVRGGFFVGGFNAGVKYPLYKKLSVDAGVFAGGGGGGSAPQGGGLMLKSYAGGVYEFSDYSLGLNYSYITFPNGNIDSSQVSIVVDKNFETLFVEELLDIEILKKYSYENQNDYIVATSQIYFPKNGTKKTNGVSPLNQNIKLLGIEYGFDVSKDFVAYIETAGALGGDSTGYMEVLGGVAYSYDVGKDVDIGARISLGSAGGGRVNTGGGAVSKSSLFMNYRPTKSLTTGLGIGYYHAFEGNFDAPIVKVEIGLTPDFLTLGGSKNSKVFDSFASQKFNLRLSHQTYFYSENLSPRNDGVPIQLIGGKLDWFLTDSFYLSGEALAAYKGGAGGYATGQFGLGYMQEVFYDFSLVGEVNIGAAGGGSLQTGDGLIAQPMLGVSYAINDKIALEVLGGKIIALNGPLDTEVLDLSFVYRFNKLVQK